MSRKNEIYHMLPSLLAAAAGNALYALTVKLFIFPANLVTGGTTGIALTMNWLFGIPVTWIVFGFNVIMLLLGWKVLGKAFAMTTLASTFLYPFFLEIFDQVLGEFILTENILLDMIFAGLGIGISLGIVIRAGASTGGMDIPPLILQKYFRIPVSISIYVFDVCILLSQAVFRPVENILYGILLVLIYTITLDKMLLTGTTKTEIKIVSKKYEDIRHAILTEVDRSVTMLEAEGGYLHNKTQVILCVVSNRELPKVEKIIRRIDSESFLIVNRVSEVRGRGFSLNKDYR